MKKVKSCRACASQAASSRRQDRRQRTIGSQIKKLRRKIAEASPGNEFIHSVYGIGY